MNVYDFDKTIHRGDSTVAFCLFVLRRHPKVIKFLPGQIGAVFLYLTKKIDKTEMKQRFFVFLSVVDGEKEVEKFWVKHEGYIYHWYLARKQKSDLIISASPEFLLKPIAEKLGVNLIASRVNIADGKYDGKNCDGEEKVKRFHEKYPDGRVDLFYSDSYNDLPLAKLAKKAYRVRRGKIIGDLK